MVRKQRKLLRVAEALAYLADKLDGVEIGEATLRNWIYSGRLDVLKVGGIVFVYEDGLDSMIQRGAAPAVQQVEVRG